MSAWLPRFDEIEGRDFATVDAFLTFQRHAVSAARRVIYAQAQTKWQAASPEVQNRFLADIADLTPAREPEDLWCRAWWIDTVGGRPRAPFEVATPPETAERLVVALVRAPQAGQSSPRRRASFEAWWARLLEVCRERIAAYTAERIASSARRLSLDGLVPPEAADAMTEDARRRRGLTVSPAPARAPGRARLGRRDQRRIREAEAAAVDRHRVLDVRFGPIGPVCGECTRQTGGCCSLTVPLLWREPDYRLLALGHVRAPAPRLETAGACPFLGASGCGLPAERRPHICRSFLCERAEQALGDELEAVREELRALTDARSRLSG